MVSVNPHGEQVIQQNVKLSSVSTSLLKKLQMIAKTGNASVQLKEDSNLKTDQASVDLVFTPSTAHNIHMVNTHLWMSKT